MLEIFDASCNVGGAGKTTCLPTMAVLKQCQWQLKYMKLMRMRIWLPKIYNPRLT